MQKTKRIRRKGNLDMMLSPIDQTFKRWNREKSFKGYTGPVVSSRSETLLESFVVTVVLIMLFIIIGALIVSLA